MRIQVITALSLLVVSTPALAAADLATNITAPSGALVYADGTYTVTVSNVGNQTASGVSLVIQLPTTGTSPANYILGELGVYSSSCSRSGATLTCGLGTLRKGKSTSVSFTIAFPWNSEPIEVQATASTTSTEPNTANNADTEAASLAYYDVVVSGPVEVLNTHCTGTNLTSFYACTLFPSSLSDHSAILHADGSITIVDAPEPGYTGAWSQASDDQLSFAYYYYGELVAEFDGNGVSEDCFEGITVFPDSAYVSPYEVCLQ